MTVRREHLSHRLTRRQLPCEREPFGARVTSTVGAQPNREPGAAARCLFDPLQVEIGVGLGAFVANNVVGADAFEVYFGGLSGGEQVIVTWHSGLTDGAEIEIANLDGKPYTAASQTQTTATGTQKKEPASASEEADK